MQPTKPPVERSMLGVWDCRQPMVQPLEHAQTGKQGETFGSRDEQQQKSCDYERPRLNREQHA